MNNFISTIQNWNSIELSQPQWLWLIPLFIAINITMIIFNNKYIVKTSAASLYDSSSKKTLIHPLVSLLQTKSVSGNKKLNFSILYLVIFSFLILGLSQPVRIGEKLPDPPQERDIIFIVDASVSMILRDYILNGERIDRMSLLKGVLDNFIENLKGEKMSIIVFGDQAFTLVPLTSDQYLLRRMLSRVQATIAGRFNAIGDAIALAVKQATKNQEQTGNTNRKRVLVLLTDADQPTGSIDPLIAAELAKNAKLPLYTIAIGATRNIKIGDYVEAKIGNKLIYLAGASDERAIQKIQGLTIAGAYGDEVALVPESFFQKFLNRLFLILKLLKELYLYCS